MKIIQIAGHNIYNLAYQKYFSSKYRNFSSFLNKLSGEINIIIDNKKKVIKKPPFIPYLIYYLFQGAAFIKNSLNKDSEPGILFLEETFAGFMGALLVSKPHKLYYFKVDWHYQHNNLFKQFIYKTFFLPLEKYACFKAEKIFCFNKAIKDELCLIVNQEKKKDIILISPPIAHFGHYRKKNNQLIFFGIIRKDQHIEEILYFLEYLKKKDPSYFLHLFGNFSSLAYENHIKNLIKTLNLEKNTKLYGYCDTNSQKLINIAANSKFGFAFFDAGISKHVYYGWPSKILFYLNYGINFFYKKNSSAAESIILTTNLVIPIEKFEFKRMFELMKEKQQKDIEKKIKIHKENQLENYL